MKKPLLLALIIPACVVGSDGQTPVGDDDPPPDDPPPTGPGISGRISADQTWTGPTLVSGVTIIDPGVTVTISPSTVVSFSAAAKLEVQGSLVAEATKGAEIIIQPEAGTQYFIAGIEVSGAGTISMAYVNQTGGKIKTLAGGTFTAVDTKMSNANGDFLIMDGGAMNITYSQIGADVGGADTTHCNLHFGGLGNQISITRSNIIGTPYALMFYGGTGAIFTDNNWTQGANATPTYWIDSAAQVTGDFSNGYFSGGPPTPKANAILTVNTPSGTPLIDAGVR